MPESAAFKSQLPRLTSEVRNIPPVGAYNPDVSILGKQSQGEIVKNQMISQSRSVMRLQKPKEHPVSFNSEVERFNDTLPKEKLLPIRGPGYYEVQDQFKSKKSSSNPKLFSESRRFTNYGSYIDPKKGFEPGPGHYYSIKNGVENRSFNLLYH